jgi:hypothetical protein
MLHENHLPLYLQDQTPVLIVNEFAPWVLVVFYFNFTPTGGPF